MKKLEYFLRKNKLLRKLVQELLEEEFRSILLKLLIAEELTKDVKVSEETLTAIDRVIKESAWRELRKRWKL